MHNNRTRGFTLVEILIVVVILGILAAIVVPQFTNASQEATKGALASQLQTINSQIELYRVQHNGELPETHVASVTEPGDPLGGATFGGWGVMVESDYLKDEPNNGWTRSSNVDAVGAYVFAAATDGTDPGWVYNSNTADPNYGEVAANGYDHDNNLLFNETTDPDYVAGWTPW